MGHVINAVDITADHSEAVDVAEDADVAVVEEDGVGDIPSLIQININQIPINTIKTSVGIIEEVPKREDGVEVEVEVSTTNKLTTKRFRNVLTPQTNEIKILRRSHTINLAIIAITTTINKQTQNRSYAGTAIVPIM